MENINKAINRLKECKDWYEKQGKMCHVKSIQLDINRLMGITATSQKVWELIK